jgi:hypothetical protein
VPKPVVGGALLGIGKHRVGLGRVLEALGRVRVIRILIRVVLVGLTPVRRLDLVRRRRPLDPEDLVVVAFHPGTRPF